MILTIMILLMLSSGAYLSTAPITYAAKATTQEKGLSILSNVIGLDLSKYATIPTVEPQDSYLGVLPQENVRYTLCSNGSKVDMLYTFANGSLRMIDVLDNEGSPRMTTPTVSVVEMAKAFLSNYQAYSGNPFYGQLRSTLDTIDPNKNSVAIFGNTKLEVNSSGNDKTLRWTFTINGVDAPDKCVVLGYRNGFLKYFIDNWNFYRIGSIYINLSEKEAIDIAMANAKTFSWKTGPYNATAGNGTIQIANFNVTQAKVWQTAFSSSLYADKPRSEDPFILYPMRSVWVSLDKFYPGNVYGVNVFIWADTKGINRIQERFSTMDPPADQVATFTDAATGPLTSQEPAISGAQPNSLSVTWLTAVFFIAVFLGTLPIWLFRKKNTCAHFDLPKHSFKVLGILFCLIMLFSALLSTVATVSATRRATIWGAESTGGFDYRMPFYWQYYRKTLNEVNFQVGTALNITSAFADNGYNASDYQGSRGSYKADILNQIYINEANYMRVAVVDFDHGVYRTDYPQAPNGERHYLLEDTVGVLNGPWPGTVDHNHAVYDMDIANQTTLGKTFFAFINTCMSANTEFQGPNNGRPQGMPYAWTHLLVSLAPTSNPPPGWMSHNGYTQSDSNPFCYLGFPMGSAALAQSTEDDYSWKNYYLWVEDFFAFALKYGMSVNQALDQASYSQYNRGFSDTYLYKGFTAIWPMWDPNQGWHDTFLGQHQDTLVVYGNGNTHLRPGLDVENAQSWYWSGDTVVNSVATGDVDGDGANEVVTGGYYFDGTRKVAQLMEWNGSTLALKRQTSWYWTGDTVVNSVAIGDVDGDGAKEIVTGGSYNNGITNYALLHVWNGATLTVENCQSWCWTSNTVVNSVAIGDVDGDGSVEIVTGGSFNNGVTDYALLHVWSGATLAVENVVPWLWNSNTRVSSVAVGNVDGDGATEIVTGGSYFDGTRLVALLHVWNGASLTVKRCQSWYWTGNTTVNSVAIGNVDNDAQVEIVTGGYCYDGTRKVALLHEWIGDTLSVERCTSWYWTSNTEALSVALANVDSSSQSEIVTGGYCFDGSREVALLHVWDGSSLAVQSYWTWFTYSNTRINSLATGNLDSDPATEIATGGYFNDGQRLNAQLITWENVT